MPLDRPDTGADAAFIRELRRALYHLYDPTKLRQSPLLGMFGLDRQRGPAALQRILSEAILALKPPSSASAQSGPWRTYRTLSDRYVDQFSQREVATGLGLSIRQMKRQERLALEVLAAYLHAHHDLQPAPADCTPAPPAGDPAMGGPEVSSREHEMQWVEESFARQAIDLQQMIHSLLKVVAPLTRELQVTMECAVPNNLPRLAVQLTPMRQALLNVLTTAITAVPRGRVHVRVQSGHSEVTLGVEAVGSCAAGTGLSRDQAENLDLARQLAGLSGGSLAVLARAESLSPVIARFTLPVVEQAAVLVIDDNADTLRLFERYLAGSRYPFIGTRDPEQALALAESLGPRIIVLDVMLPGVDGWELLGRLREHPKTRGVPVIVCSILSQKQLALSLGAAEFMHKPVSRETLLAALDRQLARPSPGSA